MDATEGRSAAQAPGAAEAADGCAIVEADRAAEAAVELAVDMEAAVGRDLDGVEEEEEEGEGGDAGSVVEHDEVVLDVDGGGDSGTESGSVVECAEDKWDSESSVDVCSPLTQLVNDRMADRTMNLHMVTGSSLLCLSAASAVFGVAAGVLALVGVGLANMANTHGASALFDAALFVLVVRAIVSVWVTLACGFFTYVVLGTLSWSDREPEEDSAKPRLGALGGERRIEPQVVLMLVAWTSWLTPPLNPVITAVELWALSVARAEDSIQRYVDFWPRQRYASLANSIYVSAQFYVLIYMFKWTRLEAIKRERAMRRLFSEVSGDEVTHKGEVQSFGDVRTLRGLIPRMAALYAVARIAVGQGLDFDMGWIPGIAWITVARVCGSGDAACTAAPLNAQAAMITVFCAWDLVLVAWIVAEWYRARRILSLYYLLQGRVHLVTFETLVTVLVAHSVLCYLFAVIVVGAAPLLSNELTDTGASLLASPLGLVLASWVTCVCYLALPCSWDYTGGLCVVRPCGAALRRRPGWNDKYRYVKSFNELANTVISNEDAFVSDVETLNALSEDQEQTDFPRRKNTVVDGDTVTRATLVACLERDAERVISFDMTALLWNFAHTTYLTGSSKYPQSDSDVLLLVEDERFALVEQIMDEAFDSYCAVFASPDMIVVAFRGNGARIWGSLAGARGARAHARASAMRSPFKEDEAEDDHGDDDEADADADIDSTAESDKIAGDGDTVGTGGEALSESAAGSSRRGSARRRRERRDGRRGRGACPLGGRLLSMCGADEPLVRADLHGRYVGLRQRVTDLVDRLFDQRQRPVFLTGHGVGGAFASMCAGDLAHALSASARFSVYAFGAPRFCNAAYGAWYAERVYNHFDIANVGDAVHGLRALELFWPQRTLGRVGKCVLLDSLGNLVIDPDWLEVHIMCRSRRKRFNGHEPVQYTSALMMWAHRLYGKHYRPLWTSPLHEIKLAMTLAAASGTEQSSLQSSAIRSYLGSSAVGCGVYKAGACVRIKVLRITGLHAKKSRCIISCGPLGISSALWEVGKTKCAALHERSTLAGLNLVPSEEAGQAGAQPQDEGGSEAKASHRRKNNTLGLGVDAEALAAITARFADFGSSEPMFFGTLQKLRPCAHLTIAGVDSHFGLYGTVSLPITKLFPIPAESPKTVSFELTGRARKEDSGELKVHLEVQNVGQVTLEAMCSSQEVAWARPGGGSGGAGGYLLPHFDKDLNLQVPGRLHPKIRLSPAMATFYLKRNFNRNSQRVVLRVGVMRAATHTLDLKLSHKAMASELFCELRLGNEHARTRGCKDVRKPEWNELFTFGKLDTLTGFEELRVELYATWGAKRDGGGGGDVDAVSRQRSGGAGWSAAMAAEQREAGALAGPPQRIGALEIPLSAIITKFQDSLLIKWADLEPDVTDPSKAQLPGHFCLSFEVGTEALQDRLVQRRATQSKVVFPSIDPDDGIMLGSPSSSRGSRGPQVARKRVPGIVRHASGSLRQIMSLAANPMSGNFRGGMQAMGSSDNLMPGSARSRVGSTSTLSLDGEDTGILSQIVPDDWVTKCANTFDERKLVVRVYVQRANINDKRFAAPQAAGTPSHMRSASFSSTASLGSSEAPAIDPFCEVSLLDPMDSFEVTQKKKTVIIRDSSAPVWEEEFTFGRDRAGPVRGNEVLCVAAYHWELGAPNHCFGQVRIPLIDYAQKLNTKESHASELRFFDQEGKPLPHEGPSSEVFFAVIVNEYISREAQKAAAAEQAGGWQLGKSPML